MVKRFRGLTGHAASNANVILPGQSRASRGKARAGGINYHGMDYSCRRRQRLWTQYHNVYDLFHQRFTYGGWRAHIGKCAGGKGGDQENKSPGLICHAF